MEEFPYYGLSWFLYLVVAAGFLLLSAYKTRVWSFWIRLPLLSFIAAMAVTPGVTMSGETWWSPAAIIMIFMGSNTIYKGLTFYVEEDFKHRTFLHFLKEKIDEAVVLMNEMIEFINLMMSNIQGM